MAVKLTEELAEQIKSEYFEGYIEDGKKVEASLRKLSEKFGVSNATLTRRAKKQDWLTQKNVFQSQRAIKESELRAHGLAKKSTDFDDRCLTIANGLLAFVGNRIQEALQTGVYPVEELRSDSITTLNAQKIGRLALGEVQEIKKVESNAVQPDSLREIIRALDTITEQESQKFSRVLQ